jgi:hypothetical protein
MPLFSERQSRGLLWLCVLAVCWRWVLAMRTPIASEDGVTYLWMAQRFAAGDFGSPLGAVFPPLLPLLIAPLVRCGVDATVAGQIVGCVCSGAAVAPIAILAQMLRPGAGIPAALLAATASLGARNAAEVYTEPLFVLLAATAAVCGLRQQPWRLGLLAALAALTRPEGIALPFAFVFGLGLLYLRALLPVAVAVLAYAGARALAGHGFDPIPKLGFHVARDDLPGRGDVLANLLAVPQAYLEAFGPAGVLLPLGFLPPPDRRRRPLGWSLLLGVAATCTFVVRKRFLLNWAFAVWPLAAAGLLSVRLSKVWRDVLLGLAMAFGLVNGWTDVMPADRAADRLVGAHLGRHLGPGDTVAGDMPQLIFYAGRQPPPPRHFTPEQLAAQARAPGVRYVAVSGRSKREAAEPVEALLEQEFARYRLPGSISAIAEERGIVVLVRK